jgi:tRNA (guanine37-N1)-methyltransferase
LLSGDHGKIEKWRREQSLTRTLRRRPDILEKAELSKEDQKIVEHLKSKVQDESNNL